LDRLHPFDTGAFSRIPEIQKDHFHPEMKISDFELDPDILEAVKIVEKFYSTNQLYIENTTCVNPENFRENEFEARSYASLISHNADTKYDNRVSTIEMIYKQKIPLNRESLIQVIIPHDFLEDPIFKDKLNNVFNITNPLTYYSIKGNPIESFGAVYNEYRKFADSKKMI